MDQRSRRWVDEHWNRPARLPRSAQSSLPPFQTLSGHGYALSSADAVAQIPARLDALKDPQGNPRFPLPAALPPGRVIEDIHKFWMDKRSKLKKSLIRRFWPPTSSTDQNPHHCFRPYDGEKRLQTRARTRKNDSESWQKLSQLSNELRGGLELLQLVSSREEVKRDLVAVCVDAFEQSLYEVVDTSGIPRSPTTLHLRGEQGSAAAVKVKLRLKGTGTFRGAAGVLAGDSGIGGDVDDVDGGYAPRKPHPKQGSSLVGRPSLKRDGAGLSGNAPPRQAVARPHNKASGALVPLGGGAGAGGRKADAVKRRSTAVGGAGGGVGGGSAGGGGGLPGYWDVGVRSGSAALGSSGPTFYAGYRGFSLGEWAPPRTVMPHHADQALLAHEDPLQLAFGLGMRLGVTATPQSLLANARGVINAVLPSRSQIFPMDAEYVRPVLPAVFRGDVSVQRRMLVSRKLFGFSAPGLSWEGHAGSGLVEGVGAGFSHDGRGWEDVGFAAGSELLLLDGEGPPPLEGGEGEPADALRGTPSPAGPLKRTRCSDDDDEAFDPHALLRPRVSRGGRLVVDRIPQSAGGGALLLRHGAAATLLAHRKRLRVDEQRHAWTALVDVPDGLERSVEVELSTGVRIAMSASTVACPSRMHLEHLYAYEGEATDGSSLHIHAFRGYSERVGSALGAGASPNSDPAPAQVARGMSSALLAESEFHRVGSRAARPPAIASRESDDELLSLLPHLLPGGGADSGLDALSARLQKACADAGDLGTGSLAFARQKRRATRVLGVSGSTGSVPAHAVKVGLQRLFSSSRLPVPAQHESFLADRLQKTDELGEASATGTWQPSDLESPERLAASFSIQPPRFEELWRADDSEGEDLVASLYSSTAASAGYGLASHCSFVEALARGNTAGVALGES